MRPSVRLRPVIGSLDSPDLCGGFAPRGPGDGGEPLSGSQLSFGIQPGFNPATLLPGAELTKCVLRQRGSGADNEPLESGVKVIKVSTA